MICLDDLGADTVGRKDRALDVAAVAGAIYVVAHGESLKEGSVELSEQGLGIFVIALTG